MSGYLRSIVYKGTFDGDAVEVELKPLKFEDALKFRSTKEEGEVGALLRSILPDYVVALRGLRAADGSEITKEEMLSSAYFAQLVVNAGLELVGNATVRNPQ